MTPSPVIAASTMSTKVRGAALGGALGPLAFIGAWSILGATRDGYSPINDAISRLAELGSDTRPAMTLGFVTFGVAVPVYAVALRAALPGRAWATAAATGIATLGVAAFPLGGSTAVERAHGVCAGIGYATLAATPLLASRRFAAAGRTAATRWALASGITSAACLVATTAGPAHGFWQRFGLAAGDAWLIGSALTILRKGSL